MFRGSLPEVDPKDVFLISVLFEDWLQALFKSIDRCLTCTEDGESRQLQKEGISNKGGLTLSLRKMDLLLLHLKLCTAWLNRYQGRVSQYSNSPSWSLELHRSWELLQRVCQCLRRHLSWPWVLRLEAPSFFRFVISWEQSQSWQSPDTDSKQGTDTPGHLKLRNLATENWKAHSSS